MTSGGGQFSTSLFQALTFPIKLSAILIELHENLLPLLNIWLLDVVKFHI